MNDQTWEFLRVAGGTTAEAMFDELSRLRRLESPWEGVPATLEAFIAALEALQADGRASRVGELWLPEFPAPVAKVERREAQTTLFG